MSNHFMTPDQMPTVDRVLNDILIEYPVIEDPKTEFHLHYNIEAIKINKMAERLREKYEAEVDIVLDEQAKYHEEVERESE